MTTPTNERISSDHTHRGQLCRAYSMKHAEVHVPSVLVVLKTTVYIVIMHVHVEDVVVVLCEPF